MKNANGQHNPIIIALICIFYVNKPIKVLASWMHLVLVVRAVWSVRIYGRDLTPCSVMKFELPC